MYKQFKKDKRDKHCIITVHKIGAFQIFSHVV